MSGKSSFPGSIREAIDQKVTSAEEEFNNHGDVERVSTESLHTLILASLLQEGTLQTDSVLLEACSGHESPLYNLIAE